MATLSPPAVYLDNIVCNEPIYLGEILLFMARGCIRARDLDHAARSGTMVNQKPCSFAIAVTRYRPRSRPDVCLV